MIIPFNINRYFILFLGALGLLILVNLLPQENHKLATAKHSPKNNTIAINTTASELTSSDKQARSHSTSSFGEIADTKKLKSLPNESPLSAVIDSETRLNELVHRLFNENATDKLPIIFEIGIYAADINVPYYVFDALETLQSDASPDVARLAKGTLDDLRKLQNWKDSNIASEFQSANELQNGGNARPELQYINQISKSAPITELSQQAISAEDEVLRYDAISRLALQSDKNRAEIMMAVYQQDTSLKNRLLALQVLQRYLSIGLDTNNRIYNLLREAQYSSDMEIEQYASKAIQDLEKKNTLPIANADYQLENLPQDYALQR